MPPHDGPISSKAQRLLGTMTATTSFDSRDCHTHWEDDVKSAMPVSILSPGLDRGPRPSVRFDTAPTAKDQVRWEQESDTIPRHLQPNAAGPRSIGRQTSNSTLSSFYDKTNVPLAVSQQTSASAMAKGLPNKAVAVLDITNTATEPKKKSRPSRLDLGRLLQLPRSSHGPRTKSPDKSSPMTDLGARSPSVLSMASTVDSTALPRSSGGLRKKLTMESLRTLRSEHAIAEELPETDSVTDVQQASLAEKANLHSLYEHYERTAFRDTPDSHRQSQSSSILSGQRRRSRTSPTHGARRLTHLTHKYAVGELPSFAGQRTSQASSSTSTPRSALTESPGDYATSVSSQHTRTSKASRRTDGSFTDFNPHLSSVLSLSDSDDEESQRSRSAQSHVSDVLRGGARSPADDNHQDTAAMLEQQRIADKKRRRGVSIQSAQQFLSVPKDGSMQLLINPRTSSVSKTQVMPMMHALPKPYRSLVQALHTPINSSRMMNQSRIALTSLDTNQGMSVQTPPYVVSSRLEADILALASPLASPVVSPVASPIQSPVEPLVRPESLGLDDRSTKTDYFSGMHQPRTPSEENSAAKQSASPDRSNRISFAGSERFMVVSKEEERLLAAMRLRRKLKKDGNARSTTTGSDIQSNISDPQHHTRSIYGIPSTYAPSHNSDDLVFADSTYHSGRHTDYSPPDIDRTSPPRRRGSFPRADSVRSYKTDGTDATRHKNVLIYLDRPIGTLNECDLAEPSPDLNGSFLPSHSSSSYRNIAHHRSSGFTTGTRASSAAYPSSDEGGGGAALLSAPPPMPPMPELSLQNIQAAEARARERDLETEREMERQRNREMERERERQREIAIVGHERYLTAMAEEALAQRYRQRQQQQQLEEERGIGHISLGAVGYR